MTRMTLPFGRGLDRASGQFNVDPASQLDLRNVLLREGKAEVRPGIGAPLATIAGITSTCHITQFRAKAIMLLVVYDGATRAVKVYSTDLNGYNPTLIGTWGTLANGAVEPPTFSSAESFGIVLLAHNEPSVSRRLVTQTYDGTTLANLTANLDNTSAKNVLYRGVVEHMGYGVGWGFGSDSDKNRPEVVRISKPIDPSQFEQLSYFIAGAANEPVLTCRVCAAGLLALKSAGAHLIVGSDKRTFGIVPVDHTHGVAGSRLAVTVSGTVYSWTGTGPRMTADGYFLPLEIPLELDALLPAGVPSNLDLATGHAEHRPDEQIIIWWFPDRVLGQTLGVCLSLRAGDFRWSYLILPMVLSCTGRVAPSAESSVVDPGFASAASHSGVQVGATYQTRLTWTHNAYIGDETVEFWGRQGASAYTLLASTPIDTSGATQSHLLTLAASGSWDLAIRYVRGGQPRSDHVGTDPTAWPVAAKATGTITALPTLTPGTPSYSPAATIATGTWGLTWSAPVSGGIVDVLVRSTAVPYSPGGGTYAYDGVLVHTSAPDAVSVAGLDASDQAGRTVDCAVRQRLTVNGIAGSSLTSAYGSALFFGLNEAPTPDPSFPIANIVSLVSGATKVDGFWVNSASVAGASAGDTEVYGTFSGGFVQVTSALVAIPAQTVTGLAAPTPITCAVRGLGAQWNVSVYLRHRLTVGGLEQYTQWLSPLGSSGIQTCQL